jgi:hypothetical protein
MFTTDDLDCAPICRGPRRASTRAIARMRGASGKCSIAGVSATVAAIGGAALLGGAVSARGASKASRAQRDAAQQATDTQLIASREANALQEKMFNKQNQLYAEQIRRQEPGRHAGQTAQNKLMDVLGLTTNPKVADYNAINAKFNEGDIKMDPGYQWRLQQGQQALERSAAARGGLFSGRAAKDLTDYSQGMASQEYGNAYNRAYGRFQDNKNNLLSPLQSLTGVGQTALNAQGQATQSLSGQAGAYGQSVGNNMITTGNAIAGNQMGAGNARASGYVGQANAINGIVGQGINAYQNNELMKRFPILGGK